MSNKTAELNTQWQFYAETFWQSVRVSFRHAPLVKQMAGHLQMGLPPLWKSMIWSGTACWACWTRPVSTNRIWGSGLNITRPCAFERC